MELFVVFSFVELRAVVRLLVPDETIGVPDMINSRSIAYDVTFTILYIGVFAAMAVLTVMLLAFAAFGIEFGPAQHSAAVLNVFGWALLPFAPRLYRRLVGHPFSWRSNCAFGGGPV